MLGVGDDRDETKVCEARVTVLVDKDVRLRKGSSQRAEV